MSKATAYTPMYSSVLWAPQDADWPKVMNPGTVVYWDYSPEPRGMDFNVEVQISCIDWWHSVRNGRYCRLYSFKLTSDHVTVTVTSGDLDWASVLAIVREFEEGYYHSRPYRVTFLSNPEHCSDRIRREISAALSVARPEAGGDGK